MRIYIAGPMTGLPQSNYPAFNEAAARWRAVGWDVENPAEHFNGAEHLPYREFVDCDILALKKCHAIAMLPNWDAGHSGAIWEHAIARDLLGINIYDAMQPVEPPLDGDMIVQQDVRMPQPFIEFVNEAIPLVRPSEQFRLWDPYWD